MFRKQIDAAIERGDVDEVVRLYATMGLISVMIILVGIITLAGFIGWSLGVH